MAKGKEVSELSSKLLNSQTPKLQPKKAAKRLPF